MRVISFVSGKGGVGKTSLTANVAVSLQARGHRVLAVDLDPQNSLRLQFAMEPGDGAGLIREGMQQRALFDSPQGVNFLPFGQAEPADLKEFARFLRKNPRWVADNLAALQPVGYDFVCIDTPPGSGPFLDQALQAANQALIVVAPDAASYATLPQFRQLIASATQDRPDFNGAYILINRMPVSGILGHQIRNAMAKESQGALLPVTIHRDPRVGQALAQQETVVQHAPSAMVSMDIQYLVDWLLENPA
ncbi:MAG: cellulose biosynthesis protein BcsQ [Rhodanobacter sp.]